MILILSLLAFELFDYFSFLLHATLEHARDWFSLVAYYFSFFFSFSSIFRYAIIFIIIFIFYYYAIFFFHYYLMPWCQPLLLILLIITPTLLSFRCCRHYFRHAFSFTHYFHHADIHFHYMPMPPFRHFSLFFDELLYYYAFHITLFSFSPLFQIFHYFSPLMLIPPSLFSLLLPYCHIFFIIMLPSLPFLLTPLLFAFHFSFAFRFLRLSFTILFILFFPFAVFRWYAIIIHYYCILDMARMQTLHAEERARQVYNDIAVLSRLAIFSPLT